LISIIKPAVNVNHAKAITGAVDKYVKKCFMTIKKKYIRFIEIHIEFNCIVPMVHGTTKSKTSNDQKNSKP